MDLTLAAGLGLAAAVMGSMFIFGRRHFWVRAAAAGAVIGMFGAVAERQRLRDQLHSPPTDIAVGVIAAALLYAVFWFGNEVLERAFPTLRDEVQALYGLRSSAPGVPLLIAAVAFSEELFWRGFVQARAGLLVATLGYALVLVWERKAVLLLAAVACGATWGVLFAWRHSLVAPIVSHVLWDLAIMVFLPVRTARAPSPRARRRPLGKQVCPHPSLRPFASRTRSRRQGR
jgi:membrane protease YdiL (CAAX protease family)